MILNGTIFMCWIGCRDSAHPIVRGGEILRAGMLLMVGVGANKALTLAGRMPHLIESGVALQRICRRMFTQRAVDELLCLAKKACRSTSLC